MLARRIGKRRDGARMAEREGHPHVDHVGDRQIGFLARLLVEDRVGKRFERQDRLAVDRPVEPFEQAFGMSEEQIGEFRFVGAAAALCDHRRHGLEAMGLGQDDCVLSQRHHADRKRHGIALQAARQPVSVPALVELTEIFADLLRKTDALRDPLRNLAMAGQNRNAHLQSFGKALLDGIGQFRGRRVGEQAREGANEGFDDFRVAAHVDAGKILAKGDLVAKRRRQQVGVGVASDVAKQGLVIDIAALT